MIAVRRLLPWLALAGCAAPAANAPAPRTLCGWETVSAEMPRLEPGKPPPIGADRVVVVASPSATFGEVRGAIEPLGASLVRMKVPFDDRWLLPLTFPRAPRHWPKDAPKTVQMVGSRRITRLASAPAVRIAELSVEPGRVRLVLEGGAPRGEWLSASSLAGELRRATPPVDSFALVVRDGAPWGEVTAVLAAAACYDRGPGEEPHEVVLAVKTSAQEDRGEGGDEK